MALSSFDTKATIAAASRGDMSALATILGNAGEQEGTTVTTATLALNLVSHEGRVVALSRAAGQAVTLPAATGSGARYRLLVTTTVTGPTTIKVANAADTMIGVVHTVTATTGAGTHQGASGTDDTITLNGTTTGGIAGSSIELVDAASTKWFVRAALIGSGILGTALSATV